MKIGYARVSDIKQELQIQIDKLTEYGCEKIYSEKKSGKDNKRDELIKLLDRLREGDTFVVYRVDRIARSLKGLIEIAEELNKKNVQLVSLDRSDHVDTTSPMGKAFFHMVGVFAELERSLIRSRVKDGVEKAIKNGKKLGRKPGGENSDTPRKKELIKIYISAGKTSNWIRNELKVCKNTVKKVKDKMLKIK